MEILIIPFILCLALAAIPFLIQLFVCMATRKIWVQLVPAVISAAVCIGAVLTIASGAVPGFTYIGNAFDWMLLLCMCAALVIAHGVPFLILGKEK